MNIIEDFLTHYNREFDFFAELSRTVQQKLEFALLSHGVRAMVTSRAKRPDRLQQKLVKRNKKTLYKNFKAIYKDIKDLAGVRVALYFPADRDRVERVIKELFVSVRTPKKFPETRRPKPGKRFIGYVATHYLIHLKPDGLQEGLSRYSDTAVEIQVASVLMHAWAEVDHDLVYKPEKGELSEDELAILDEINGLVLTGEIALERLQKAIERRSSKDNAAFKNEFELASYLAQRATKLGMPVTDIGRVDVLISVLRDLKQDAPAQLGRYLERISPEDEANPIADVVLDKILAAQPKAYAERLSQLISQTLSRSAFRVPVGPDETEAAVGYFLNQWIALEKTLSRIGARNGQLRQPLRHLIRDLDLSPQTKREIENLTALRNDLVHGGQAPNSAILREAASRVRDTILPAIKNLLK
jgi:ppGpp synthetase/RelA/SpoT-type nucleotidyltranferase